MQESAKVVLVTGPNNGIGFEAASLLGPDGDIDSKPIVLQMNRHA